VYEVDTATVHAGAEVGEAVDRLLLRTPVETVPPVLAQLLDVREVRAIVPACTPDLIGPTSLLQSLAQVVKRLLRNLYFKRLYAHLEFFPFLLAF